MSFQDYYGKPEHTPFKRIPYLTNEQFIELLRIYNFEFISEDEGVVWYVSPRLHVDVGRKYNGDNRPDYFYRRTVGEKLMTESFYCESDRLYAIDRVLLSKLSKDRFLVKLGDDYSIVMHPNFDDDDYHGVYVADLSDKHDEIKEFLSKEDESCSETLAIPTKFYLDGSKEWTTELNLLVCGTVEDPSFYSSRRDKPTTHASLSKSVLTNEYFDVFSTNDPVNTIFGPSSDKIYKVNYNYNFYGYMPLTIKVKNQSELLVECHKLLKKCNALYNLYIQNNFTGRMRELLERKGISYVNDKLTTCNIHKYSFNYRDADTLEHIRNLDLLDVGLNFWYDHVSGSYTAALRMYGNSFQILDKRIPVDLDNLETLADEIVDFLKIDLRKFIVTEDSIDNLRNKLLSKDYKFNINLSPKADDLSVVIDGQIGLNVYRVTVRGITHGWVYVVVCTEKDAKDNKLTNTSGFVSVNEVNDTILNHLLDKLDL